MNRNLAMIVLALQLWFLHGLDVQFYTIQDARLFDINLFMAVMSVFILIAILFLSGKHE